MSTITINDDDGTFQYTLLTPKYLDAALNVARNYLIKEENISKACRISEDPEAVEELITRCTRPTIELGLSMVAIEKATDLVAAITTNKIILEQPSQSDIDTLVASFKRPAVRDALKTALTMKISCNLFDQFDIEKNDDEGRQNCLFELSGLCTVPQYRGRGIGRKMLELGIEMATALNRGDRIKNYFKTDENETSFAVNLRPKIVVALFTSVITQKHGELLNFTVAASKSFDNLETHRGEKFSSIVGDDTKDILLEYRKIV